MSVHVIRRHAETLGLWACSSAMTALNYSERRFSKMTHPNLNTVLSMGTVHIAGKTPAFENDSGISAMYANESLGPSLQKRRLPVSSQIGGPSYVLLVSL